MNVVGIEQLAIHFTPWLAKLMLHSIKSLHPLLSPFLGQSGSKWVSAS